MFSFIFFEVISTFPTILCEEACAVAYAMTADNKLHGQSKRDNWENVRKHMNTFATMNTFEALYLTIGSIK